MAKPKSEKEQLAEMNDLEVVAYWNILQMSQRCLSSGETRAKVNRHHELIDEILNERNIPHESGKLVTVSLT